MQKDETADDTVALSGLSKWEGWTAEGSTSIRMTKDAGQTWQDVERERHTHTHTHTHKPIKPKRLYSAIKPLEKCHGDSQMEVLLDNESKGFVDSWSNWGLALLVWPYQSLASLPVTETKNAPYLSYHHTCTARNISVQSNESTTIWRLDTKTMGGVMVWSHGVIATVYISVSRLLKKSNLVETQSCKNFSLWNAHDNVRYLGYFKAPMKS